MDGSRLRSGPVYSARVCLRTETGYLDINLGRLMGSLAERQECGCVKGLSCRGMTPSLPSNHGLGEVAARTGAGVVSSGAKLNPGVDTHINQLLTY